MNACNDGNNYANPIESTPDSEPPILEIPIDLTLEATGFETAVQLGSATAIDLVDGVVSVTNNAPATFPVGITTVTYTATDAAGNNATATQTIIVMVAAEPTLTLIPAKGFQFDWIDTPNATFYRLLENPDGVSGFAQIGTDIPLATQTVTEVVSLYLRLNAQYILQSCNSIGLEFG